MSARNIGPKFRDSIVPQLAQRMTLVRARLPKLNLKLPQWPSSVRDASQQLAPKKESSELFWEAKSWALQWDGYALFDSPAHNADTH